MGKVRVLHVTEIKPDKIDAEQFCVDVVPIMNRTTIEGYTALVASGESKDPYAVWEDGEVFMKHLDMGEEVEIPDGHEIYQSTVRLNASHAVVGFTILVGPTRPGAEEFEATDEDEEEES
jgi:hypothetical protein